MRLRWLAAGLLTALCAAQSGIPEKSNTAENLRGITSPSPTMAWASGTHGIYLRSLDGGTTWRVTQVPGAEELDFRDVEAFDTNVAYLLSAGPGEQSRIYKTIDGGARWNLQFTNHDPKGFLDCMAFWDRNHGIALGDPVAVSSPGTDAPASGFFLITTEDGGAHWKQIPPHSLPPAIAGEGAFAASGTCLAVEGKDSVWFATGGKAARVFRSTDRGKSWAVADTPIIHGEDSSGIFSIAFRDAKHGVIAGGDYKHPERSSPNLAFTEDGGATWKLSPLTPQPYASAIAFLPRQNAIVTAGTTHAAIAYDLQKKDWSKSWDLNLNALTFISPEAALAVGPGGTIVKFEFPK